MFRPVAVAVSVCAALLLSTARAHSIQPTPPTYDAVIDRGARAKPALIHLGAAGFSFNDPVFGSRMWRVTDPLSRRDDPGVSYRTPSSPHQAEWSADGTRFYVVATDGTVVPFVFDVSSATATPQDPLHFYIEPQFSYVLPRTIYGSRNDSGASLRTIDQYDFSAGTYTQLLDLDSLVPGLAGTFVGGIGSSAGVTERVFAFFGGPSQDLHHFLVVFDRAQPANRHLLDTAASTLDGHPTSTPLNFHLHSAAIDRSGRFVILYPTSVDLAPPRSAAHVYVWALDTNTFTALESATALSDGHDSLGYGAAVNQDCCASNTTTWDAASWEWRSLTAPLNPMDLIAPTLEPHETYLADHSTWNNARPDLLVPFITATYRYGDNPVDWRAWDDEILAVETDATGGAAEVWRFAHHRSDVRDDNNPSGVSFWYEPRPNVSDDGRWVLFTSNWEKTLGTDPRGPDGGKARQDVFLLRLKLLPQVPCGASHARGARSCGG